MAENCKKRPGSDELCDGFVCGQNIKKNSINADRLNDESFEEFLKWVLTCKFGDAAWFRDVICNIGCEGVRCNLELDPSSQANLDREEGMKTVIVTSEKPWRASTNDSWYQLEPASASGTAVMMITAGPYDGRVERIGTLFVTGCDEQRIVPLTVFQPGARMLTMWESEMEYPSGEVACYTFHISTNLNVVDLKLNNGYAYFKEIRQLGADETQTLTLSGKPRNYKYNVIGDPGREKSFVMEVDVCMTINDSEEPRSTIFEVSGVSVTSVKATLTQGPTEDTHLTVDCPQYASNLPASGDGDVTEVTINTNKGNTTISIQDIVETESYLYITRDEDVLTFAWDDTDDPSDEQTVTLHAPAHINWERMLNG